jgi:hypothetical protein
LKKAEDVMNKCVREYLKWQREVAPVVRRSPFEVNRLAPRKNANWPSNYAIPKYYNVAIKKIPIELDIKTRQYMGAKSIYAEIDY